MATLAQAVLSPVERRVLERFVEELKKGLGDDLRAVWLYGSRARSERTHEESDVDLIVLTRAGDADRKRVQEILYQVAEEEGGNGPFFSARVRDQAWLEGRREIQSFFIQEVDRDKIVLYGHP